LEFRVKKKKKKKKCVDYLTIDTIDIPLTNQLLGWVMAMALYYLLYFLLY
jgi:hypothetical protein